MSEGRRPTVIIADDHPNVHPLIGRILEREFDVVKHVFDGQELFDAAVRLHPDLIVVDIIMPVLGGVESVQRLKAQSSTAAVVFISADAGKENVQRALKTGARAFVRKASAAEDLLPAARAALKGRRFVSIELN